MSHNDERFSVLKKKILNFGWKIKVRPWNWKLGFKWFLNTEMMMIPHLKSLLWNLKENKNKFRNRTGYVLGYVTRLIDSSFAEWSGNVKNVLIVSFTNLHNFICHRLSSRYLNALSWMLNQKIVDKQTDGEMDHFSFTIFMVRHITNLKFVRKNWRYRIKNIE